MRLKRGIVLLEVLISVMLGSFIFMSLAGALFQLSRGVSTADYLIDTAQRMTVIMTMLERDFVGSTIPVQAHIVEKMKKNNEKQEQKKEKNKTDSLDKELSEKNNEKPISHLFYSVRTDNQTTLISCVTTNPVPIYWSERAGRAKPRIVRVIYRLKPDKDSGVDNVFILTRQESSILDFNVLMGAEKGSDSEEVVITGIKNFHVAYGYRELGEKSQDGQKDLKIVYKQQDDWPEASLENEKKGERPLFPHYAQVTISLWDALYKKDQEHVFVIQFIANEEQLKAQAALRFIEEKKEKPKEKALPPKKNDTGGAQINVDQLKSANPEMAEDLLQTIVDKLNKTEIPEGTTEIIAHIADVDDGGGRNTIFKGPIKITPDMLRKSA